MDNHFPGGCALSGLHSQPLMRLRIAIALVLFMALTLLSAPAFAQGGGPGSPTDLEGEWRRLTAHEDAHERSLLRLRRRELPFAGE